MQARAPKTQKINKESFLDQAYTDVRWLGNAGALINSRGTTIMIDPVLSGFDMPLLIDMPIMEEEIDYLDAILLTHSDNDHYSRSTCEKLSNKTREFHAPKYVASLLDEELSIKGQGHDIYEKFKIKDIEVTLTPANHTWQNESEKHRTRVFKLEDYCGFWLDTPDGSIWVIGDSRLMEDQLKMPSPDLILFDISDSRWHVGIDGMKKLAETYRDTPLLLWHYGSVDAPEWKEFNGDPEEIKKILVNPERILVLGPGESYKLKRRRFL